MKSIKINNGELFYNEAGTGHPILFLHAGITDSRMWQIQVDYFSKHYRTIICDLRGYGASQLPNDTFAYHEDIKALLDGLDIESAFLVGASFGGRVAVDFCLTNPDYVKGLVLVSPSISGFEPSQAAEEFGVLEEQLLDEGKFQEATDLNIRMWVDGPHRDSSRADPELRRRVFEMQFQAFSQPLPPNVKIKPLTPPAMERLYELSVPMLVVSGDQDELSFIQLSTKLASTVKGAKRILIPGAGHLVSMEAPEKFNPVVDEFLNSIK